MEIIPAFIGNSFRHDIRITYYSSLYPFLILFKGTIRFSYLQDNFFHNFFLFSYFKQPPLEKVPQIVSLKKGYRECKLCVSFLLRLSKGNKNPCLKRDDFLKIMKLVEVSWTYSSAKQPTGIISLFYRGSYISITSL